MSMLGKGNLGSNSDRGCAIGVNLFYFDVILGSLFRLCVLLEVHLVRREHCCQSGESFQAIQASP